MSYHGKLQTLKNGTADAEIQQWAYQQLEKETVELTDEEILRFAQNIFYFDESYSKNLGEDAIRFARAILRKANEK